MLGAIAGGKGSVKIINDCYFHDCINCCAEILGPSNYFFGGSANHADCLLSFRITTLLSTH